MFCPTRRELAPNRVLFEYVGELLTPEEAEARAMEYTRTGVLGTYLFDLPSEPARVIDAYNETQSNML